MPKSMPQVRLVDHPGADGDVGQAIDKDKPAGHRVLLDTDPALKVRQRSAPPPMPFSGRDSTSRWVRLLISTVADSVDASAGLLAGDFDVVALARGQRLFGHPHHVDAGALYRRQEACASTSRSPRLMSISSFSTRVMASPAAASAGRRRR